MRWQSRIRVAVSSAILLCAIELIQNSKCQSQDPLLYDQANAAPEIQVLLRMDRNQDRFLQPAEVPVEALTFVSESVDKFHLASITVPDSQTIDLAALVEAAAVQSRAQPAVLPTHSIDPTRICDYAKTLVYGYDKNGDGVLSREESQNLSPTWKQWDYDRNGYVSSAEVTVWIRAITGPGSKTYSQAPSQFVVPFQFANLDANADGQIQMHEFGRKWTKTELNDFNQNDANRDSIITLQEWLQHQVRLETSTKEN